jgi:hypothetical protein
MSEKAKALLILPFVAGILLLGFALLAEPMGVQMHVHSGALLLFLLSLFAWIPAAIVSVGAGLLVLRRNGTRLSQLTSAERAVLSLGVLAGSAAVVVGLLVLTGVL